MWRRCWPSTRGSWGGRTHSRSPSSGWPPASTRPTAWLVSSARWKIACMSSRRHAGTARCVVLAASERPTYGPRRPLICTRLRSRLHGQSLGRLGPAVQPCSLSEPPLQGADFAVFDHPAAPAWSSDGPATARWFSPHAALPPATCRACCRDGTRVPRERPHRRHAVCTTSCQRRHVRCWSRLLRRWRRRARVHCGAARHRARAAAARCPVALAGDSVPDAALCMRRAPSGRRSVRSTAAGRRRGGDLARARQEPGLRTA